MVGRRQKASEENTESAILTKARYARLNTLLEKYATCNCAEFNYQNFANDVLLLSGAKHAIVNRVPEHIAALAERNTPPPKIRTEAVAGLRTITQNVLATVGLGLVGREWDLDDFWQNALQSRRLVERKRLHEAPTGVAVRFQYAIAGILGIDSLWSVGLFFKDVPIGTVVLSTKQDAPLENTDLVEILVQQVGHALYRIETEKALREEKERVAILRQAQSFIDASADMVIATDLTTQKLVYCNRAAEEKLGLSRTHIDRHVLADVDPTLKTPSVWQAYVTELREKGAIVKESLRRNIKTNKEFPVELSVRYVREGDKEYAVATVRDITLRKEREALLQAQRTNLDQIYAALDVSTIMTITDEKGIIRRVNKPFCDITGYSADEVVGKSHSILSSGYHSKAFWKQMWRTIMAGQTFRAVVKNKNRAGEFFWLDTVITPLRDQNGKVQQFLAIRQNVTPQMQAEIQLLESERDMAEAHQLAKVGRWETYFHSKPQIWSPTVYAILEIERDGSSHSSERFMDYIHPDDREKVRSAYRTSVENHSPFIVENRLLFADGRVKWVRQVGHTEYDQGGEPLRSLGTIQDITEAKLADQELLFTRAMLERVGDVARIGGWELDIASNTLYWSSMVRRIFGVSSSYIPTIKNTLRSFVGKQDAAILRRNIFRAIGRGATFRTKVCVTRQDKSKVWVRIIGQSDTVDGKTVRVFGTIQDIDSAIAYESAIEKQNEFRKLLAEISADFVKSHISSFDDILLDSLKKCGEYFEFDRVLLMQVDIIANALEITHAWRSAESIRAQGYESKIALAQSPWLAEKLFHEDVIILRDTKEIEKVHPSEAKEWQSRGIGALLFLPLQIKGMQRHVLVFAHNHPVNEWHSSDVAGLRLVANTIADSLIKNRLEQKMFAAVKSADTASRAKSQFLAHMSHEIRTPLNGIIGFTDLLMHAEMNKTAREYLKNANVSARSLLDIVNNILDFSRIEANRIELDEVETDIFQLIDDVIDIVKLAATKKGIELLLHLSPEVPRFVIVDGVKLRQVLVNIINNAIKFTDRGEVELSILGQILPSGDKAELTFCVRDTGIGMTKEEQSRIFRAFTQADASISRRFGGTGLGLVISSGLIEKMGSKLQLQSEVDKGSRFQFSLTRPCSEEKMKVPELGSRFARALILEDNRRSTEILIEMLSRAGIQSETATSIDILVKLLTKHKDPYYGVVFIDASILGTSGHAIVEMLQERNFVTIRGAALVMLRVPTFASSTRRHDAVGKAVRSLLKPVNPRALFALLETLSTPDIPRSENVATAPKALSHDYSDLGLGKVKILIAEDTEMNVHLVQSMLAVLTPEAEIVVAENGAEAVTFFFQHEPDIVLMDIQMPVLDGVSATKDIRHFASGDRKNVPVLALTAGVAADERERCEKAGMNDFLTKPLTMKVLSEALRKFVKVAS